MNAPDMLGQIGAGVEALRTEVPAAGVSHGLRPRGAGVALPVHHGRSGASAGHGALHLHQGAADAEREERKSDTVIEDVFAAWIGLYPHSREEQVQIPLATLHSHHA